MLSMTGFAVIERAVAGRVFRVQLKSVNHRHFELKWKAPRSWSSLEIEARSFLQERLKRGSVECWVDVVGELPQADGASRDPQDRMNSLWSRLDELLQREAKNSREILLSTESKVWVLSQLSHYWLERDDEFPVPAADAKKILQDVTEDLLQVRAREGAKLNEAIRSSLESLKKSLTLIEQQLPQILQMQQGALKERLIKLAQELDLLPPAEARLWQEFLSVAERRDVTEERDRIRIHIEAFDLLLKQPQEGGNGRRMDFMLQELSREWSTLGSKILEPRLLQTVIDAKIELDRIREQTANIA